ncbi:MAG TPA: hypothetical protein VE999_02145 [Gemmataceae bacterium]|nr:hypothetical protein [Gemmataceae bacterium]
MSATRAQLIGSCGNAANGDTNTDLYRPRCLPPYEMLDARFN